MKIPPSEMASDAFIRSPPIEFVARHSKRGAARTTNVSAFWLGEMVSRRTFSRNQPLNTPVELFQEQNTGRTDVLHEYFVPPAQFEAFLERARGIIPRHGVDLLNVTIRNVQADPDAFLRYASEPDFHLDFVRQDHVIRWQGPLQA